MNQNSPPLPFLVEKCLPRSRENPAQVVGIGAIERQERVLDARTPQLRDRIGVANAWKQNSEKDTRLVLFSYARHDGPRRLGALKQQPAETFRARSCIGQEPRLPETLPGYNLGSSTHYGRRSNIKSMAVSNIRSKCLLQYQPNGSISNRRPS